MKKIIIRLLILVLVLCSFVADWYYDSSQLFSMADYPSSIIRGEVLGRDERTIIIRTEDAIENITINDQAMVVRNTFNSAFTNIKPKDLIAVFMTSTGQVLAINAIDRIVYSALKLTIFVLCAGAMAWAARYLLHKTMQKSSIHASLA